MARVRLLVATRNKGKLEEFKRLFGHLEARITDLDSEGISEQIEESGKTFEENARLKAKGYSRLSGLVTIADDSGLEVDALGGAPGVLSARYGGAGLSDAERVQLLLREMRSVPGWKRTARFRAVIALSGPGVPGRSVTTDGVVEGAIAHEAIGGHGFGYDPIFWLKERATTAAGLRPEEKDRISHRGQAARKMAEILSKLTGSR